MRALIMASASLETVMVPSNTCETNSLTRFLPRSLAAGSRAMRPSSTIWSSRLRSAVSPPDGAAADCCFSAIGFLLTALDFRLQLCQLVRIGHGVTQQLLQLVVALHAAAQVGKPLPQIQQLLQRFHLTRHLIGRKVIQVLEAQIDGK